MSSVIFFLLASCQQSHPLFDRSLCHSLSLSFPEPFAPLCAAATYSDTIRSIVSSRFLTQYDSLHRTLYTYIQLIDSESHLEKSKKYLDTEDASVRRWLETRLIIDEAFLHLRQRNIPLGIAMAQIASVNAEELDGLIKIDALTILAELQYMYLDHDASLATLSEARSLVSSYPDQAQREIKVRKLQIRNYNNNGELDVSAAMLDTLQMICVDDVACMAEVCRFRALNLFLSGHQKRAQMLQFEAIELCKKSDCINPYSEADIYVAIARLNQAIGSYDIATTYHDLGFASYNQNYNFETDLDKDIHNIFLLSGRAEALFLKAIEEDDYLSAVLAFNQFEEIREQLSWHTKSDKDTYILNRFFHNFFYSSAIQLCGFLYKKTDSELWIYKMIEYMSEYKSPSLRRDVMLNELLSDSIGINDSLLLKVASNNVDLEEIIYLESKNSSLQYNRILKKQELIKTRERLFSQMRERYQKHPLFRRSQSLAEEVVETSRASSIAQVLFYIGGEIFNDNIIRAVSIYKGEVEYYEIENRDLIFKKIDSLYKWNAKGIGFDNVEIYASTSHSLYDLLFRDLFDGLGRPENILIVPDTKLHQVSFEALVVDKKDSPASFRNMNYLVSYTNISYGFLVNPIYDHFDKEIDGDILGMGWSDKASILNDKNKPLPELPGAFHEIQMLRSIYSELEGAYFSGEEATKVNFLNSAPRSDFIHLGLHGRAGAQRRLESKLYFRNKMGVDSLLIFELLHRNVNPQLVVLSSCETNSGRLQEAEGHFSLARGFVRAGAKSVVSSLWDLDDHTSFELIEAFYLYLFKNYSYSKSLTDSKRSYLNNCEDQFCHPYFWAGLMFYQ